MLRVTVESADQAETLLDLEDSYDFWTQIGVGRTVDIRAAPEQMDSLVSVLEEANISHSVMIADVQALVKMTKMVPVTPEVREAQGHSMDWTDYHPIEDIHSYLTFLQVDSPRSAGVRVQIKQCF